MRPGFIKLTIFCANLFFAARDDLDKTPSEVDVENDIDHRIEHGVRVGQKLDPVLVIL